MPRLFLALIVLCSSLAACATPYQRNGATGGFSDLQLNSSVWQVRARGNGYSSSERVEQLLLRRCADITLNAGDRYFVLLDQAEGESQHGAVVIPPTLPGGPAFVKSRHRPRASATMRILGRQTDNPLAVDAVEMIHRTDAIAHGQLSPRAKAQMAFFEGKSPDDPHARIESAQETQPGHLLGR